MLCRDDHDEVQVGVLRLPKGFPDDFISLADHQDRRKLFLLLHPPLRPSSLLPTDRPTYFTSLLVGQSETAVEMPRFTALRVRKGSVLDPVGARTCKPPKNIETEALLEKGILTTCEAEKKSHSPEAIA